MKTISVRIKHNSATKHAGQRAHDLRTGKEKLDYVDYSLSPRNSFLIRPASSSELRSICETRRSKRETKRRMKSNASVATNGIITFSKEAQEVIEALPLEEQDERLRAAAEAIAKHLGTTLHGLVVHRDESAIHAHFTLAAYTTDGKPLSKATNRLKVKQLQDVAAKPFADLGITRGKPKEQRISDGEPAHKWINRSVRQLHNDLPAEIKALEQRIEELTEKERRTTERLEKTLRKLQDAGEENEKLQKRVETYQKRLEATQQELKQAQSEMNRLQEIIEEQKRTIEENQKTIEAQKKEIDRLKKLTEPHKPEPIQIEQVKGWEEKGVLFKRKEPILKPTKVITPKAAEKALIATRKAAEIEARRKAEAAVLDKLERLQELEQQLEQNNQYQDMLLEAIEKAAGNQWLSSAQPEHTWHNEQNPPEIVRYNATLLDYNTKLVAVGDGTPTQQAAAIYKTAKEKGWEKTIFWGMNEAQIEWLVKAAMKDGYDIDFKEAWAKDHAEKLRQELQQKQPESDLDRGIEL